MKELSSKLLFSALILAAIGVADNANAGAVYYPTPGCMGSGCWKGEPSAATVFAFKDSGDGTTESQAHGNCDTNLESTVDQEDKNGNIKCPKGTGPVAGKVSYNCNNQEPGLWVCICSVTISCEPYY